MTSDELRAKLEEVDRDQLASLITQLADEDNGIRDRAEALALRGDPTPRWTPQKRPLIDTSKPAISGMAAETGGVLPRGLRGAQVGLDLRAPAAWPALEDMAMMQQAIQQGGDGRGVAE